MLLCHIECALMGIREASRRSSIDLGLAPNHTLGYL